MDGFLEKVFKLKDNNTTPKIEVMAGITTFMTMAYILAVNPSILSITGMDAGAVFMATAIGSAIATAIMAISANYPFALAPGMGLNAFFAFTVCGVMGYTWQMALAAVFIEGLIFLALSLTPVREAIFNCIPMSLKCGVSAGIGFFIAFIGMQSAKIVVGGPTLVALHNFRATLEDGTFATTSMPPILALIGLVLIAALYANNVRGAILYGILATWGLGIIAELTGFYIPNPELGYFSTLPNLDQGFYIPSLAPTFMQMDFSVIHTFEFAIIIFSFMFVDLFDTLGTLIGVSTKAKMLDSEGKLPQIKGALLADSIGTSVGAVLGTSTVSTYVESSSGVSQGGRTGLTAVTVAVLFLLSILLAPLFLSIAAFATAPALIFVGFLMISSLFQIDFEDITEAFPAYLSAISMGYMYSIAEGIAVGVLSYVVINIISGKFRTKPLNPIMVVLAIIFFLKYCLI